MYHYSLFSNYIFVSKNSVFGLKFFRYVSTDKIKDFITRHFCSPKKWEKANFLLTKMYFRSDLKHVATVFFSFLLRHLSNIILPYILLKFVRLGMGHTSKLSVNHFKVYDLGIFDSCIGVGNKFLPFKLISVCHSAITLVPRQIFRNVLKHITISKNLDILIVFCWSKWSFFSTGLIFSKIINLS